MIVVELNDDPACWNACHGDIKEGDLSLSCWFAHLHATGTHSGWHGFPAKQKIKDPFKYIPSIT
jgi:hypothetical protein